MLKWQVVKEDDMQQQVVASRNVIFVVDGEQYKVVLDGEEIEIPAALYRQLKGNSHVELT